MKFMGLAALLLLSLVGTFIPARPAAARTQQLPIREQEHLPRRARPPGPGKRPAALPPYEQLATPAMADVDRRFDRLVDEFLLSYFMSQPVRATRLGLREYDAGFPTTDSFFIEDWGRKLGDFSARLDRLDAARLTPDRRSDHALLSRRIRQERADIETVAPWRHDPRLYVGIVSDGIHALVDHDFAALEDRTWNVVARLTGIPDLCRHARRNLVDVPSEWTRQAIDQAADLGRFLANELAGRVMPMRDPALIEEFEHHLASATGAVAEYRHWLKTDLLPRATADPAGYVLADAEPVRPASPLDSLLRR